MATVNSSPANPETSFILALPDVVDQAVALCNSDVLAFKNQEYARLREHDDPTEWLIQNTFADICTSQGDDFAYRFMAGSLAVTRSVYVSAEEQDIAVERPAIVESTPFIQRIVRKMHPTSTIDISDMDDRFAVQPALCNMVRQLQFTHSRVGALAMMGLYARQLMPIDYTLALTIDGELYSSVVRRATSPPTEPV